MFSILPPIIKIELVLLALILVTLGFRWRRNRFLSPGKISAGRLLSILLLIAVIAALMVRAVHLRHQTDFSRPLDVACGFIFEEGAFLQSWISSHPREIIRGGLSLILLLSAGAFFWRKKFALPWIFLLFSLGMASLGWFWMKMGQTGDGIFFLVAAGLYAFFFSLVSDSSPEHSPTFPGLRSLLPLALIVLIGSLLRIYKINLIPYRFDADEAIYGLEAIKVLKGVHPISAWSNTTWRGLGHLNYSPVYTYILTTYFLFLGTGLVALKLLPITAGIFSIVLTYLIAANLFHKRLGIIAAFFLAVSPLAINYSRCGLLLISTQTVGLLIIYLLLRAIRLRDRRSYFLLGVIVSFAGYMYSPIKQVILLTGFLILLYVIFQKGFLIRHAGGIVLLGGGILLVALLFNLPVFDLIYPQIATYESVWHRTQSHLYTPQPDYQRAIPLIWENFQKLITTLFQKPHFNYDPWPRGNLFLNPALAVLSLVGIIISLSKISESRYRLLLFFLGLFVLPNLLSRPPLMTRRLLYFMPFLYIAAALPLYHLGRQAARLAPNWGRRFFTPVLILFFVLVGLFNSHIYFDSREPAGLWEKERSFDEEIKSLLGDYFVYVYPKWLHWCSKTIDFLCHEKIAPADKNRFYRYISPRNIDSILNSEEGPPPPLAFVFYSDGAGRAAIQSIKNEFPQAKIEKIISKSGEEYGLVCHLEGKVENEKGGESPASKNGLKKQ